MSCFSETFTAIYLGPKPDKNTKYPLLVWSHGGPHGCTANIFRNDVLFYAKLGKYFMKNYLSLNNKFIFNYFNR